MAGRFTKAVVCFFLCGSLAAAESGGVWLDIPFVKQDKNGCGAASLAMLIEYWRQQGKTGEPKADDKEIQRQLYAPRAHGIYASDMELYLRRHHFQTFAFQGQWKDLVDHLQKGRPLIVAIGVGRDRHYVVVAGFEGTEEQVLLENDPSRGKLVKQDREKFEKEWKALGNWTLLAVPLPERASASQSR